jgi:hypothetical protein
MHGRLLATFLAIVLAGSSLAPFGAVSAHQALPAQALSVCDYAQQLASLRSQTSGFNPDFNKPLSDQYDQLSADLDALNGVVSNVQQLTPPAGFEQFHADLVSALQQAQSALQQIVDALDDDATPPVGWEDVLQPVARFVLSVADKYPDQGNQIAACPSS